MTGRTQKYYQLHSPHDLEFKDNGLFEFGSLNIQLTAMTEKHLHYTQKIHSNTEKPKTLIPKQKKKILEAKEENTRGGKEGRKGLVASWNQMKVTILWYVTPNGGKY